MSPVHNCRVGKHLEAVAPARPGMQLGLSTGGPDVASKGDTLITENLCRSQFHEGVRQTTEVCCPSRGRVGGHLSAANEIAKERPPAQRILIGVPHALLELVR